MNFFQSFLKKNKWIFLNKLQSNPKVDEHNFPQLTEYFSNKKIIFRVPPFTTEVVQAIKLIAPHQKNLAEDEQSRKYWEKAQNAVCWGEYEALSPYLKSISKPSKILDIGPGFGRSVVFFKQKLKLNNTDFHLYERNGNTTKYTQLGPRLDDSFCGNIPILQQFLLFNKINNFKIFDAQTLNFKLYNLPGPYDLIYSFYSIGFHWSLEHFFEEILSIMHEKSLACFTVPNNFVEFEQLKQVSFRVLNWRRSWPPNSTLKMLILSKKELPV